MAQGHPFTPPDQNSDSSMSEELPDTLSAPREFHHSGPKPVISSSSEDEAGYDRPENIQRYKYVREIRTPLRFRES